MRQIFLLVEIPVNSIQTCFLRLVTTLPISKISENITLPLNP